MTQVTLPSGNYLLVEVPEDAFDFDMTENQMAWPLSFSLYSTGDNSRWYDEEKFPPGQWSIIGKRSELLEADCMKIVEEASGGFAGHIHGYKDYNPQGPSMDKPPLASAYESLNSLIARENLTPSTTLILKKIQP